MIAFSSNFLYSRSIMTVPVINLDDDNPNKEIVVKLDPPNQKTHLGALVGLLLTLLFLAAIAFGVGWFASKITNRFGSNPAQSQKEKNSTSSALPSDWTTYSDKNNHYSISYPKDWDLKPHDKNSVAGVILADSSSSVELWLKIDHVVSLSSEQKAGLKSTDTKSKQIGDHPAVVTTNEYKAGNFFNIIVFPATETQDQVTFWLKADDSDLLDLETKIVESFKFN